MIRSWALLIGPFVLAGALACAQSGVGPEGKQNPDTIYVGVSNCAGCHSQKSPSKFSSDSVLMTEYDTWQGQDKHSQAFDVLRNKLAKEMGAILGYDPAKKDACLNCHAVNVPAERQGSHFRLQDGVSCEACHGPAKKWLGEHQEYSWRLKSFKDKESLGMIDVRNPITQARVCLSCHLGSAAEGKILTHEMLAAGHPPLPGFELASYHQFMPRHWRLARDVPFLKEPKLDKSPAAFKDPTILKKHVHDLYQFQDAALEQTRLAVLNGIAVFQASMELLADLGKGMEDKQEILDLALFNCSSCHHELKKQNQSAGSGTGRPRAPAWPGILVPVALRHIAGADQKQYAALNKEYGDLVRPFHEAFVVRPFGDPAKIGIAADKLAAWAGRIHRQATRQAWDQASARRLLDELAVLSQQQTLDYDGARQVAWAYKTIQAEVFPGKAKEHLADWKTLDREMHLMIRPGKYLVQDHLTDALHRAGKFDPATFAKSMRAFTRKE